jgi:hypothetical protein
MKNALSLTALALLATALVAPMQADAANRQITVNGKKLDNVPTFTVNDSQDAEVADATPEAPQVVPKAFRVDDKPGARDEANNEDNTDAPVITPKKPVTKRFRVEDKQEVADEASVDNPPEITPKKNKTFRFRVEDQSDAAAAAPGLDTEDDVASSDNDRPASLLNEEVKLVKKPRPAPVESQDDEAATDETDHSADIAADSNGDVTSDEVVEAPVARHKPRVYFYAEKQNSYDRIQNHEFSNDYINGDDYAEPVTYSYQHIYAPSYQPRYVAHSYQPRYYGSSCHNRSYYSY